MTPRLATACLSLSFLLGLGLLTGCGGSGSNTDCDLGGCTITFARSGGTSVSVLGIEAKLVGVQNGQATLSVAGHEVNVPVGGETQSEGFTIRVERLTDTEVVVRVTH
ncbi:hypothetical protein [Pseudonocardia spinosispora]|uniref:hypothetical protein n=1 Tax=Pseudonocardia spinosispora TaxID=103441 RepID=UPI0003F94A0A|nr:hypothetical protein [Pseudonocardia spinosispora]